MRYSTSCCTILLTAALTAAGCDDANPLLPPTTGPELVAVTDTFSNTLTVNGGRTHPFTVERVGSVTATLSSLSTPATTIGLSLGTWNGASCQIIIANDAATVATSVIGTAQTTGQFCVRLYDVGTLTGATTYSVEVTHF